MKQLILFSLIILNSFWLNTQELEHVKEISQVEFKIKNLGLNVDGSFLEVEIDAHIDENNLETSFINSEIIVNSIETGMESRDAHILKEDFFDEPNYKTISFKSYKIKRISIDSFHVDANLTIKDITKKVSFPIFISTQNEVTTITSNFEINRIDYGVGGRSLVLGKKVKINVRHSYSK